MPSKEELQAYKGAEVAKVFPLYGPKPFKGNVARIDVNDEKTPFRIVYEDGDSEWISLQELKSILVNGSSKSDKKRKDDAPAAAGADQQEQKKQKKQKHSKSSSQQQPDAAAAAAAGTGTAKADKAAAKKAPAAAASGGAAASGKGAAAGVTSFTITAGAARAAADKAAAGTSKDAAAAPAPPAASGKGVASGKPSKAAAAAGTPPPPAAAAAGTPGRKAAGKGAAGVGGASMSTADTQNILAAIHQAAAPTADKLVHDRQVARMPRQGPGAAVLPAMSQAVVAGGCCYISLQTAPKPRHSTTPGKSLSQQPLSASGGYAAAIDYRAESEALLGELQRLLSHSGTDKRWLLKVSVTLRSMRDGLPGFQEAWNAWAQRDELPVMSLVEGAGPFSSAGVMLEATALVNA